MASGIKLAKHAGKTKQNDIDLKRSKQTIANQFLSDVYDALLALNVNTALNFIKKPYNIEFCNTYNTKYGLHALLVLLAANTHNWSDVFNEMTDRELQNLKKCISAVKHESQPKAELAKSYLLKNMFNMSDNQDLNLSQIINKIQSLPFNKKIRAKTLFIVMTVADSWDVVTDELNKLSVQIDGFKRAPRQIEPVVEIVEKPTVTTYRLKTMSTEELSQKLGYKNLSVLHAMKNKVLNRNSDRRAEIKSWFSTDGKFFIAKHFDEFKSLCAPSRQPGAIKKTRGRAAKKMTDVAITNPTPVVDIVEPEVPVQMPRLKPNTDFDKKSVANNTTPVFDQVAVTGIQTFLKSFLQLCESRKKMSQRFENIMESVKSEQDLDKQKEFLDQAIEINMELAKTKEDFESKSVIADNARKLLQDRENAMKQLDAVNADLANIWQEIQQNVK